MTTFLNTIAILFFAFAILSFIFNEAEKKTLETEKSPRVQKEIYQSVVVEEHIGKQSYPSQDTFESDTEYNSNMSYSLNSDLMNEFRNRMGLKKEQNIVMDNKNILSKKEPLEKKLLYMREFIYQYIRNQNNSNYKENWQYIKLIKAFTEKNYIDFWESHQEQFILYEINQESQTFTIVIDYESGYTDELLELHLKQDENQWFIINTKVLKRLKEFDKWKVTGDEKLQSVFSYTKVSQGSLYFLQPSTNSYFVKSLNTDTEVKFFITTEEGKFYMSKWSFNKLLNGDISQNRYPNWILVQH